MKKNQEDTKVAQLYERVLRPGNTFIVVPFSENAPQESGYVTKNMDEAYEEAKILAEKYHTVYIFYVYGSSCAFEKYSEQKHGEILKNLTDISL